MTDPIADLLTRIRNAQAARHDSLSVSYSSLKMRLLKILVAKKFVAAAVVEEADSRKVIKVVLNYNGKKPAITEIKRVSKPGGRVYRGYSDLRPYLNGYGVRILSTSQGLLDDASARKAKVGGEVLCEIW